MTGAPRRSPLVETLADPSYRRLWLAGFCANNTRWVDLLVLGWVVLQLTGSPFMVGVAAFCRAAPMMLVSPFAGLLADRLHRGRVLATTQSTGCLATGLLAAAFALGAGHLALLLAVEVVIGVAWAVDFTTRRTSLYALARADRVASAVSLETVSLQFAKMVGPVTAGIVLERAGAAGGYLLLSLLHLGALAGVLSVRRRLGPAHGGGSGAPTVASLRQGWREAWSRPMIRGVLVVTAVMNLLVFPYQQMLPVFARDVYRVGAAQLGLLLAADGLGALAGALAVAARRGDIRHGSLFAGGALVTAGFLLVMALVPSYALALVLLLCLGVAESCFATMQGTIITVAAPGDARGRVMGMLSACMGTQPLGSLWLGFLVSRVGAPAGTAAGAALALVLVAPVAAAMTAAGRTAGDRPR